MSADLHIWADRILVALVYWLGYWVRGWVDRDPKQRCGYCSHFIADHGRLGCKALVERPNPNKFTFTGVCGCGEFKP